jgi:hypothetical protein
MQMHLEETYNTELLWELCSDEEIINMHQRLIDSLSPEENLQSFVDDVAEYKTHSERLELLQPVLQEVPPEMISYLLSELKSLLSISELNKLKQELPLQSFVFSEV